MLKMGTFNSRQWLLSLLLLILPLIAHTAKNAPICEIATGRAQCDCAFVTNGEIQNVTCNGLIEPEKMINRTVAFGDRSIQNFTRLVIVNNEMRWFNYEIQYENLTFLDLSHNKIQNVTDLIFTKLHHLETLILSFNIINYLTPNVFQGDYRPGEFRPLLWLRVLMLDHNQFHSLDADLFEHTPNIEFLYLNNNPLKMIDDPTAIAITSLTKLKSLDLSYTKLSKLPSSFLHTPRYLSMLNLTGNLFEKLPEELKEAHNLTVLIFDNNPLFNLSSFNGFPTNVTLKVLHMSHMPNLRTVEKGSMSNLPYLEELYMTNNVELSYFSDSVFVTDEMIRGHGADLRPPIRKLYLNNNKLSYLNMSLLGGWKSLSALDLRGNPWVCEYENQWMVTTLMPIYLKIDEEKAKQLKCGEPIEMANLTFYELYRRKYVMRPLDYYGARPEKDAVLLVAALAGVLIGIPVILFALYSYKRHWFGIFDDSPASFTRHYYRRADSSQDIYEY